MESRHPGLASSTRWLIAGIALVALDACAEPTTPVNVELLLGQWASADAEFIAIRAGAELRLGCVAIIFEAPISLTPEGHFASRGGFDGPGAHTGKLPLVSVTGTATGTQLRIAIPDSLGIVPSTKVLDAGAAIPPVEAPMCPQ